MGANHFLSRLAGTRLGVCTIKRLVSPIQRTIYLGSNGCFFSGIGLSRDVLPFTTKGRHTGADRTPPVFFLREGDLIIICNVSPAFEKMNPWAKQLSLAIALGSGQLLPTITPIVGALILTPVLVLVALFRFQREGF